MYLGLVLVGGAAPQVFAHSATTRNFEISEEIEFIDNLDTNPDGESSTLSDSLTVYFQDIDIFLNSLRKLRRDGKFDLENDSFEVAQATLLPCVPENKVGSYTANTFNNGNAALRPSLEWLSKRLTDGYSLADCLPNGRFNGTEATESRFNFKLDNAAFVVEVGVKKRSGSAAEMLSANLRKTFRSVAANEKDIVRQRLNARTAFKSKNDQVFVVTRLPRAALDSLLATNAK